MIGTLRSSSSNSIFRADIPNAIWRDSSDCTVFPTAAKLSSPTAPADEANGRNKILVNTYSNENEIAIKASNGPAVMASSKNDLGTVLNHRFCVVLAKL